MSAATATAEAPPKAQRALKQVFGEVDESKLAVKNWERFWNVEESYKINYDGLKLAAVHHWNDNDGPGVTQLYLRYLGSLHLFFDPSEIAEIQAGARRSVLEVLALVFLMCVAFVGVIALNSHALGISVSVK